jgi:hypothetical protein
MGRVLKEKHRHPTIPQLSLDLRSDSPFYQARAFIDGRQRGTSTKTTDIRTAYRVAESWYRQERRAGQGAAIDRLSVDPILADVYRGYVSALEKRKRPEVEKRWSPIEDFWKNVRLIEIGPKTFRDFYVWRRRHTKDIGAHTLHKDNVLVRQVLKYGIEQEMLDRLPIIPKPGKINTNPRPWLTESEWQHLRAVSRTRIDAARGNGRLLQQRIDTDHFMRFMVSSCGRVNEIRGVRFRDCCYRLSETGAGNVLICAVTGKSGPRNVVADADAVEIISAREGKPDEFVFSEHHRDCFRELLIAAKLRTDAEGLTRNFKSLRATAISRLVLAGKDLMFISRNAGTSIQMIDTYYAKRLIAEMSVRESHPIEAQAAGRAVESCK